MQRVYVLEKGAYLRKDGENLVLTKDKQNIEEVPVQNLQHLVLVGYTSLSGAVLNVLIKRRIETVFLDPKWRYQGRLNLDEHKHVKRRKDQYLSLSNSDYILQTSKLIVAGKRDFE